MRFKARGLYSTRALNILFLILCFCSLNVSHWQKTHKLQQTVDEAHQRLAQAESSIARWVALADPGRADELISEVTVSYLPIKLQIFPLISSVLSWTFKGALSQRN
jgi:hypothetical protein